MARNGVQKLTMSEYLPNLIDWEHYLSKIDRSNSEGCHPWTGAKRGRTYHGAYSIGPWGKPGTRYVGAHRIMLEMKLGRPIRPGFFACHTCDYPRCCNPDHLWEGTAKDNMQDAAKKGRTIKGIKRSEDFKRKTGEAHRNRQRYRCAQCAMITESSGMSSHQKSTGHEGRYICAA